MKQRFSVALILTLVMTTFAQQPNYNFPQVDELIANEGLQNPFLKPDGSLVQSMDEWPEQKEYLKAMLMHYQYGTIPPNPEIKMDRVSSEEVLNGKAIYEKFNVTVSRNGKSVTMHCGIYHPNKPGKFPVIIKNDREATEKDDIINKAMEMGYAIAKYVRTDLAADDPKQVRIGGVFDLYPEYSWGAIGVWAWGYQLVIDAFEQMDFIDMDKIVSTGHSRGGKTALAGALFDERIAIAGPNSSGLGGTASPRIFVPNAPREQRIMKGHQSHWWTEEWYKFEGREELLPWDSHFQKILIAPRGLHNAHATEDLWANPYGTEITHRAAKEFYKALGIEKNIALHWRAGGHAQSYSDWVALMDFADLYFYGKDNGNIFDLLIFRDVKVPMDWEIPQCFKSFTSFKN